MTITIKNRFKLVQPFIQGDGVNSGTVRLFVEMISGKIHHGDIVWVQGNSFYVIFIEEVCDDDYLETYLVIVTGIVSNAAALGKAFHLNPNDSLEGAVIGSAGSK